MLHKLQVGKAIAVNGEMRSARMKRITDFRARLYGTPERAILALIKMAPMKGPLSLFLIIVPKIWGARPGEFKRRFGGATGNPLWISRLTTPGQIANLFRRRFLRGR